jgi:hypothetical protein
MHGVFLVFAIRIVHETLQSLLARWIEGFLTQTAYEQTALP